MNKNYPVHFLFLLFLFSCSKEGDYINDRIVFASPEITSENVTYQNYVKPLLTKNCATCHGVDGSAETWWLNSHNYENTVRYANPIATTIINGTMPPPPKFPFSQRDRDLIAAWIAKGMPEN
ncbi:c-type cytochrome [Flavobacterium sp. ZT3R25]|uniref:c-type cytochrome n=1 Tax=Flavobacterium galactosi TaxID=3398735 RepID=UPI003A8AA45B